MGYICHDSIVITSWNRPAIEKAATVAREYGLEVLGPSDDAINGYRSILICPDGSKEGWAESDAGDRRRAQFIEYLNSTRYDDGSSSLEWVAISYGSDDGSAEITSHAWQN